MNGKHFSSNPVVIERLARGPHVFERLLDGDGRVCGEHSFSAVLPML